MGQFFDARDYRQKINELTQRAKQCDTRITDLTIGESGYLLALVYAVKLFRIGCMTADELVYCQRDLQGQLECSYQHRELFDQSAIIRNRYSEVLTEAEKHGCPICQRLVRIFDGRE